MKYINSLLLFIPCFFLLLNVAAQNKIIPDSSYGSNGKTESAGQEDYFTRVLVQKDGRQIIAGSEGSPLYGFYLSRLNINGSIDSSFGDNGRIITQRENLSLMRAAVFTDYEKILCMGYYGNQFVIIKYLNSGKIDSSFGVNGMVTGPEGCAGATLNTDENGLIVVAGAASINNKNGFVVRYLPDGSTDKLFGRRGVSYFKWKSGVYYSFSTTRLAIQSDGRILISGDFESETKSYIVLKRFTGAGVIDSTYAVNSELLINIAPGAFSRDLKLQANNKALLLGAYFANRRQYTFVARFNTNGSSDKSFGEMNGYTIIKNSLSTEGTKLLFQPDNKLLIPFIILHYSAPKPFDFALMKTSANGIADVSFGVNGQQVILPAADSGEYMYDAAIRFDNKLITGAEKHVVNDTGLLVHRVIRCYEQAAEMKRGNITAKALNKPVLVYPNPAKDVLHIDNIPANSSEVYVTDIQGKIWMQGKATNQHALLNISQLAPGIYYVKTDTGAPAIKFVKTGN